MYGGVATKKYDILSAPVKHDASRIPKEDLPFLLDLAIEPIPKNPSAVRPS